MRTHSSGWLVGMTTLLLGGISTPPAEAQFLRKAFNFVDQIPDPARVGRDVIEERVYEHRLQHNQARLQQDLNSGNTARIQHDQRRIQHDQYEIERWQWEFRRDTLQNPGPFTYRPATVGSVAGPVGAPGSSNLLTGPTRLDPVPSIAPAAVAPVVKVPVSVTLAKSTGTGPAFVVNGTRYQTAPGQPQKLDLVAGSEIEYDRGGTFGPQRYSLTAGAYEFRPSDQGWAFYKLP